MADAFANPIVIGLLIGLPSFLLGYLGYRRAQRSDTATEATSAIAQIIDGLNQLVDNLQDDNGVLREQVEQCARRLEASVAQRDELRATIAKMLGGAGLIILFLGLMVGNLTRDHVESQVVERASNAGAEAGKVAGKAEVKAQVREKVQSEVAQQVGHALYPNLFPTTTLPASEQPIDRVDPNTTTTEPPPFDLTTTTTAEPFDLTTTTTIEVPTTVTIPDPPPLP